MDPNNEPLLNQNTNLSAPTTTQPTPPVSAPAPAQQTPSNPQGAQFMNALKYAQSNPNSPFATELKSRIQSGQMNDYMKAAGIDASKFITPPPASDATKPGMFDNIGQAGTDAGNNVTKALTTDTGMMSPDVAKTIHSIPVVSQIQDNVVEPVARGISATGAVVGGLFDVGTKIAEDAIPPAIKDGLGKMLGLVGQPVAPIINGINESLSSAFKDNPQGLKTATNLLNIGLLGLGNEAKKPLEDAATTASGAIKDTAQGLADNAGAKAGDKAVQDAIDAVNPELKGKGLNSAYEKGALKGTIQKGGILSPQSSGIAAETEKLGTSLSDIGLKPGDPAGNLTKLGNEMTNVESKITPFNSFGVEPGVKTVLKNELETLKSSIPEEFSAVKDNQSLYNKVVDYAKKMVDKSGDTVGDYRDTRTAFDAQTKREFPSAYDDKGFIDLKTPAGRAIKSVRDTLNENLYQIAPKNAELQQAISREADIYRAIHNIAPQAAKNDGLNAIQKLMGTIRKNPAASLAAGYAGDKIIKATTGIGIPGL